MLSLEPLPFEPFGDGGCVELAIPKFMPNAILTNQAPAAETRTA